MASDDNISRAVAQLLNEVQSARNDVLKADEARARTFDEMRSCSTFAASQYRRLSTHAQKQQDGCWRAWALRSTSLARKLAGLAGQIFRTTQL